VEKATRIDTRLQFSCSKKKGHESLFKGKASIRMAGKEYWIGTALNKKCPEGPLTVLEGRRGGERKKKKEGRKRRRQSIAGGNVGGTGEVSKKDKVTWGKKFRKRDKNGVTVIVRVM